MALTPGQSAPDGAYTVGHVQTAQNYTSSTIKAILKGAPIDKYTAAQNIHNTQVKQPIADATSGVVNHEGRIVNLEDGGIMTVYSGNATWPNPGTGRIGVGIINGGQAGQNGFAGSATTVRTGGNHGGYTYMEFDAADLTATVAITVGTGGATNLALGGISSFGAYLVGVSGITGAVFTAKGVVTSGSTPGSGGNNGGGGDGSNGLPGTASALAAGGTGGLGANGGSSIIAANGVAGGSVDTGSLTPCGGSGGGAGGGTDFQMFSGGITHGGGNGGAGGAPGGGGGAGGNDKFNAPVGPGGAGGVGRVFVIQSAG